MANSTPRVEIDIAGGRVVRHESWLREKALALAEVVEVVGLSRDALTHEEILVAFRAASGAELVVSELDAGFAAAMAALSGRFPGVEDWPSLGIGATFESRRCVLWVKHRD